MSSVSPVAGACHRNPEELDDGMVVFEGGQFSTKAHTSSSAFLHHFDKNNDKKVSTSELGESLGDMDTNNDGQVTQFEAASAVDAVILRKAPYSEEQRLLRDRAKNALPNGFQVPVLADEPVPERENGIAKFGSTVLGTGGGIALGLALLGTGPVGWLVAIGLGLAGAAGGWFGADLGYDIIFGSPDTIRKENHKEKVKKFNEEQQAQWKSFAREYKKATATCAVTLAPPTTGGALNR